MQILWKAKQQKKEEIWQKGYFFHSNFHISVHLQGIDALLVNEFSLFTLYVYTCVRVSLPRLQTLTVICQEIPISIWNNLVIIGSVVQSTYFFLLIWTHPRFKLTVITSLVVVALQLAILWGNFTGARGIETNKEEGAEVETQPVDCSSLSMLASLSKHLWANGFKGLTSSNISSTQLNGIISYLFMNAPYSPPLTLVNAVGVNGIVLMVMYGGLCEETDGEM